MAILNQFVLRLAFGLALGMAITDARQVTSGYYRNHLYVLLGLLVLATMVALGAPDQFPLAPPLTGAVLSYVGSVAWLYEKRRAGIMILGLISAAALWGAWSSSAVPVTSAEPNALFAWLDPLTSGLVLGWTMAAMFLGHWYLNSPTMALAPLMRLVLLMAVAVCLRAVLEAWGLAEQFSQQGPSTQQAMFISLRWLSGIFGVLALAWMAWQTLKIPNTQSATGILYVAVIGTFLGELTSLLMAAQGW